MASQKNKTQLTQLNKLFRSEYGKILSTFTRLFGIEYLSLAEKVVEESFKKARSIYQNRGFTNKANEWLWDIARIRGTEILRRENKLYDKSLKMNRISGEDFKVLINLNEELLRENQLRMLFVCCHPHIRKESQIALVLKFLFGFNITEISAGLSLKEPEVASRLAGGRKKIRELNITYELPKKPELHKRLEIVLKVLYQIFQRGYNADFENSLIGSEFCLRAIELTTLLVEHPDTEKPQTHALLSLMLIDASRLSARFDKQGDLLLLQEQDRSIWDRNMIKEGLTQLYNSANSESVSEYHLRAAVSACHAIAESYEKTDWGKMLSLYENYMKFNESPEIALDRVIVLSKLYGAKAGIDAINGITNLKKLAKNHLLYSTLGNLYLKLNEYKQALLNYKKALKYAGSKNTQSFYKKKIDICQNRIDISNKYSLQKSF